MNNIIKLTGSTDWSRDKVIDHLERCQMASSVTMPAEGLEHLLMQVLRYIDSQKPKSQRVSESCKAGNDIIAERQRQIIEEGWTAEHDDEHAEGEIASAAACYALFANDQGFSTPAHWPWGKERWKQAGQRRDLVKAGALILAEIERLDRAAPAQESE